MKTSNLAFHKWLNFLYDNNFVMPHENYEIVIEWVIGGVAGGSCWDDDDSNLYDLDSEEEPSFEKLDNIFNYYKVPTSRQELFKKNHVVRGEYEDNEYYGNYTVYATKTVQLYNLFKFLRLNKAP